MTGPPVRDEERMTMMGWYGWDHMTGWGWFAMTISGLLLLALVIVGIMVLARLGQQSTDSGPSPQQSAHHVLAERFARGELTVEEYRERLAVLNGSEQHRTPTP